MAKQLIDGMTDKWHPERYHDQYHDAVMKLIKDKIASGDTDVAEPREEEEEDEAPATINFIDVLRRSVEQTSRSAKPARKKAKAKAKATTKGHSAKRGSKAAKKRTKKKRAS
jgi:DNA end-binding protein Ku